MKEYTGDRVFQALKAGWAAHPTTGGEPLEPPQDLYDQGNLPLQTLPAPYYNFFLKSITSNDPRTADVFADIYGEFDYIMTTAAQSYSGSAGDLYTALRTLWNTDNTAAVAIETNRAQAAEAQLQTNIDAEANNRQIADTGLQSNITAEITRATDAEASLLDDINTERSRAQGAETGLQSNIDSATGRISAIEGVIPEQATPSNQLADKDFVNSSITAQASRLLTDTPTGDPFATKDELDTAITYYHAGIITMPSDNDYVVVLADETKEGAQVRYVRQGLQWVFAYKINDTPFTAAQRAAIDSTVTLKFVQEMSEYPSYGIFLDALNQLQPKIPGNGYSYLLLSPTVLGNNPGIKAVSELMASPEAQTAGTQVLMAPATRGAAPTFRAIGDFVMTTGDQTISGIKTYNSHLYIDPRGSSVIFPTMTPPENQQHRYAKQSDVAVSLAYLGETKKPQTLTVGVFGYGYDADAVDLFFNPSGSGSLATISTTQHQEFQRALDNMIDGGKVVFREGLYNFPTQTFIRNPVLITGAGAATMVSYTTVSPAGPGPGCVFEVTAPNVIIENLSIHHYIYYINSSFSAVNIYNDNTIIRDCIFGIGGYENTPLGTYQRAGIRVIGGIHHRIESCAFYMGDYPVGDLGNSNCSIILESSHQTTISNCSFSSDYPVINPKSINNETVYPTRSVYRRFVHVNGSTNAQICGCAFYCRTMQTTRMIQLTSGSGVVIRNNRMEFAITSSAIPANLQFIYIQLDGVSNGGGNGQFTDNQFTTDTSVYGTSVFGLNFVSPTNIPVRMMIMHNIFMPSGSGARSFINPGSLNNGSSTTAAGIGIAGTIGFNII